MEVEREMREVRNQVVRVGRKVFSEEEGVTTRAAIGSRRRREAQAVSFLSIAFEVRQASRRRFSRRRRRESVSTLTDGKTSGVRDRATGKECGL